MATQFERIVEITPAYDHRHADPSQNYGIHGCELRMTLKGPRGAVQFVLFTNWHLPHVTEELLALERNQHGIRSGFLPLPAAKGYHSPTPQYDGHSPLSDVCPYLDSKPCYYDGSGPNAEKTYQLLLEGGSEAVWHDLEAYYGRIFAEGTP